MGVVLRYCAQRRRHRDREHLAIPPRLQRTRAATEATFLMMQHAFALGYYRVVWRCNALNAASMRAARRFGFTYEGTWRGDGIVKGRRRDTAWFSIVEPEWPAQRATRGVAGRQQLRR